MGQDFGVFFLKRQVEHVKVFESNNDFFLNLFKSRRVLH